MVALGLFNQTTYTKYLHSKLYWLIASQAQQEDTHPLTVSFQPAYINIGIASLYSVGPHAHNMNN